VAYRVTKRKLRKCHLDNDNIWWSSKNNNLIDLDEADNVYSLPKSIKKIKNYKNLYKIDVSKSKFIRFKIAHFIKNTSYQNHCYILDIVMFLTVIPNINIIVYTHKTQMHVSLKLLYIQYKYFIRIIRDWVHRDYEELVRR